MGLPQRIPPEEQRRPEPRGPRFEKKSGTNWPIVGIIVALALVAAIIYFLPRGPKNRMAPAAAEIPSQPGLNTLAISHVEITPSPDGGSAIVQGIITNTGNQPVTEITVNATLSDNSGKIIYRNTLPLQEVRASTKGQPETVEFAQAPLPAGKQAGFRLQLSNIPQTWNHNVPEIVIEHVTQPNGGSAGANANGNQSGSSVQTGPPASSPAPNH